MSEIVADTRSICGGELRSDSAGASRRHRDSRLRPSSDCVPRHGMPGSYGLCSIQLFPSIGINLFCYILSLPIWRHHEDFAFNAAFLAGRDPLELVDPPVKRFFEGVSRANSSEARAW